MRLGRGWPRPPLRRCEQDSARRPRLPQDIPCLPWRSPDGRLSGRGYPAPLRYGPGLPGLESGDGSAGCRRPGQKAQT